MTPETPPPHRAIGWYRFMLWILPTCVALASVIGMARMPRWISMGSNLSVALWLLLNVAAAAAIGNFDSRLRSRPPETERGTHRRRAVFFVCLQFVVVPTLLFAVVMGYCVIAGPF